jgi:hypothetical protein
LNCKKRKEIMRYGFLILILFLILSGCSCGSGVDNSKDGGVDTGILCGNGYYPSFDYQCKGNTGCREINKGLCICRCVMCEDERCVGMSCGGIGCEGDGGVGDFGIEDFEIYDFGIEDSGISALKDGGEDIEVDVIDDVSDIRDISDIRDAGDGGVDDFEYVCKDPGDPVGVDFWGNLDEPIVKISDTVYRDAIISGDYVVWQEGVDISGNFAKDIYYLSLKNRKVMRVPNCDKYDFLNGLQVEGNKIYWANTVNACAGGKNCRVIFEFDLEARMQPRIVSLRDAAYNPKVYKNNLVYEIVGSYGSDKLGLYYTDLLNGNTKKLSDRWDILIPYYTTLWEREIIIGRRDGIYGLNIDTMEEKVHYKSDLEIASSPYHDRYPYVAFVVYYEKDKYGHYTTDCFLLDIRGDSVVQITDDENFQFAAIFRNGIYIYFENYDPKDSDVSYGHLKIYDLSTGVRRAVPKSDNIYPRDFDGRRLIYTTDIFNDVKPIYLMDLEKLGVVKDGHVVPE